MSPSEARLKSANMKFLLTGGKHYQVVARIAIIRNPPQFERDPEQAPVNRLCELIPGKLKASRTGVDESILPLEGR